MPESNLWKMGNRNEVLPFPPVGHVPAASTIHQVNSVEVVGYRYLGSLSVCTGNYVFGQYFLIQAFQEECLGDERLADDLREGFQNLELAIGLGFTNVNILGAMMIGLNGNLAAGTFEADIT
jgi:hypothetical protein